MLVKHVLYIHNKVITIYVGDEYYQVDKNCLFWEPELSFMDWLEIIGLYFANLRQAVRALTTALLKLYVN